MGEKWDLYCVGETYGKRQTKSLVMASTFNCGNPTDEELRKILEMKNNR